MSKELVVLLTEHQFYHVWGCVCGWDDPNTQIEHTEHLAYVLEIAGYGIVPTDHKLSRIEVIDGSGRAFTKYTKPGQIYTSRQDDNRTLKVFIS